MCLISKRKSPHRLKRDRRCWKVVYKSNENGKLKPIYYDQNIEYMLNAIHVERGKKMVKTNWFHTGMYDVGAGFVHAFSSLDNAKILQQQCLINEVLSPNGVKSVICECVIPAGTEVYFNRDVSQVCARKMRFDRII